MVTVYTQYRKHFEGPRWDDFAISEYNRKRDYRIGRRSVEHRHQPLEWDSSGSENSDVHFETKRESETQRKAGISNLSINEGRARKRDITKKNLAGKLLKEEGKPPARVKTVKQAWGTEQELNIDERFNKEMATQTTHRKHRKSKRKKKGKCKTEEEGKTLVNNRERLNERVPFVSYGWANDAPIEKKYTHNVRADPKDVYPASLRALKRRELDIAKRLEENKKKAQFEHEIIKEKFFDLSHISPMFMTEYQSSYCNLGGEKTGYVW